MSKLLYKILGTPIGGFSSDKVPKDGDGDGMFTPRPGGKDNVPISVAVGIARTLARRKVINFVKENPERKKRVKEMLLKAQSGGFTVNRGKKDDIITGIPIGRNRQGIKKLASEMYDENGQPNDEAVRLVMSWLTYHGEKIYDTPLEGAREVGVGGWIEEGMFYIDIVDVYNNNPENRKKTPERGKKQNQIAVADLDEIQIALKTGDWSKTMIHTDGDGSETLPLSLFDDIMKVYESIAKITNLRMPSTPSNERTSEKLLSLQNFRIVILEESERK